MSQSDSVAGALAGGPVDIAKEAVKVQDEDGQLGRFYDQAYRLGQCANLVYPQRRKGQKKETAKRVEKLVQSWNELNWNELFSKSEPDGDARIMTKSARPFSNAAWPDLTTA
jgi:hypothetical protein